MNEAGLPRRALFEHKGQRFEILAELQADGAVLVTILSGAGRPVPLPYEGAQRPASVGLYSFQLPAHSGAERTFSELVTTIMAAAAQDVRRLL